MYELPAEWDWALLEEHITSAQNGFGRRPVGVEEGPIVLRIADVSSGYIDLTSPRQIKMSKEEFQNYKIEEGNIIFIRVNGSLDLVARSIPVDQTYENVAFNDHLIRVKLKDDLNTTYLHEITNLGWFRSRILAFIPTSVGGQLTINQANLGKLKLPLPPLSEQEKIAEILSTWDKTIELVGKQIEAKQRLKKGLMQQLLTGKIRFPGFMDEWKQVKLKSLAKLLVSNVDKKTIKGESSIVLCNYMNVYENEYITSKVDFMPATATDTEIKKFSLRVGDVLLTKDSETREDIASTSVIAEIVDSLVCGYHLAILRPDPEKADSIFLAKHLSYGITHHHFVAYANGATRFGLTISAIENSMICVPKIDEQKRIAEVFLSLDKEIDRLESKIEILRQQKQGLMQKLLTGEVRVKA